MVSVNVSVPVPGEAAPAAELPAVAVTVTDLLLDAGAPVVTETAPVDELIASHERAALVVSRV